MAKTVKRTRAPATLKRNYDVKVFDWHEASKLLGDVSLRVWQIMITLAISTKNSREFCYATIEELAGQAQLSVRNARRAVHHLQVMGLVGKAEPIPRTYHSSRGNGMYTPEIERASMWARRRLVRGYHDHKTVHLPRDIMVPALGGSLAGVVGKRGGKRVGAGRKAGPSDAKGQPLLLNQNMADPNQNMVKPSIEADAKRIKTCPPLVRARQRSDLSINSDQFSLSLSEDKENASASQGDLILVPSEPRAASTFAIVFSEKTSGFIPQPIVTPTQPLPGEVLDPAIAEYHRAEKEYRAATSPIRAAEYERAMGAPHDSALFDAPQPTPPTRPATPAYALAALASDKDSFITSGPRKGQPRATPPAMVWPSAIARVLVPDAPCLVPSDSVERKVQLLVSWFEGAYKSYYSKACWSFRSERVHISQSKHLATLKAAIVAFEEHELAPAEWIYWSMNMWASSPEAGKSKRPPSIGWVFSAKRIVERRGWFRTESAILPRAKLAVYSDAAKQFVALQQRMQATMSGLRYASEQLGRWVPLDEDVQAVIDAHFPGDTFQMTIDQLQSEASRLRSSIAADVDNGTWIWG